MGSQEALLVSLLVLQVHPSHVTHNTHFLPHLPMAWGLPLPFTSSSQVEHLDHMSQGAQGPPASGAPGTAWSHPVHGNEQRYSAPKEAPKRHCQFTVKQEFDGVWLKHFPV